MLKVSDIPEHVLREIAGAYHRRLASTDAESQPTDIRNFQRAVYLRTALEWLALWINDQPVPATCVWEEDDDGSYSTGCGNLFSFNDGGPTDNGQKFCGYCGGTIDEHYYNDLPEGES